MSGLFRLAQISDTHVRADDDGAAAAQLRRALAQAHDYRADVILLTGDLVNDERADEYAMLAEVLAGGSTPLYLMPGNHDDRALMRSTFPRHAYLPQEETLSFVIDDYPVRIICVDDIVPGETHGLLRRDGADWLDEALSAAPSKPTIVALHHPPFHTHDLLFDKIGLLDGGLFTSVIARHRQVVRVICGHHHRYAVGQSAHAPVIVAPSTSWTYGLAIDPGQEIAPRTSEQPGWVLHVGSTAGDFASHFMGL